MERFQIQEAFTTLKPLCDSLMKNPSVDIAYNIANTLTKISDKVIQDLLEYILFPFIVHLQNDTLSKNVKEELVKTTEAILSRAKISKMELFNKLYSCLLIQIYDNTQQSMVIEGHEELKEAVLSCIKTLLHSCFTEVIEVLYTRQNASKIGQGILLSITMGRIEKSRPLRLKAIETVMALCQVDDKIDRNDITLQDQVADIIMLFLPGIVSGLQEIAMGNEIQGYKLTMLAVRAWGRIVSLVMKDKIEEDDTLSLNDLMKINNEKHINPIENFPNLRDRSELEKHLKSAKRNKEWFNACAIKLNVLVQQLDVLKRHSHYKVRKELVENIHLLVTTCCRNMKPNIMLLIEYLISLSEDEFAEVREEAEKALNMININFIQNKSMRSLVELLEENFYNLLTKLPRIIRRSDDSDQLSCLNQIAGYLKLLGEQRLPRVMMSASHVRRLILALVYVTEIDCSNISLLQMVNVKDLEDPAYSYGSYLWRRFKFIQSSVCEAKVIAICKYLGEFGDFRILIDTIFGLIFDVPQHKKELILLLNWMIHVPVKDSSVLPIYREVIELYINPELWYSVIEINEDVPLRVAQSNVIQCCLLLEGLGLIAQNLKRDYDTFLLKTLYLIIERAGSGHSLISFVGSQTLEKIAESQLHNTVGDLLRANVDYFSYHVSIKLRRVERNPSVLDVVGVVMKYSTIDVLPCLKEIVEDVLLQLNSSFQKKNSYSFLKVFYTFTICIKNLANPKQVSIIHEQSINTKSESLKVIQSLLEYYEAKNVKNMDNIEQICEIKEEEEEMRETVEKSIEENEYQTDFNEQEGKEKNIPSYIKMIEDVMKHCLHFLPSKEIEKSLIAMSTLQEGLEILSNWENQLLPIVHLLWHPLVDRFHDENVLIINRAWQLLNVLGHVSKDFIRSRTLKQVLPALSKFLSDSAKKSYNKNSENIYKFTQTYKLQKELLFTLGQLTKNLSFHERETWNILSITELYLNKHQNPMLQAYCIQLYKDIADYNSDIVLVKCLSIFNSKIRKIAMDTTFNIKDLMITENNLANEYFKNVYIIIKYIQDKTSDF
ncbi:TELO2-interacting protein 1 like protein [Eufriesea mexicana]|uniref:TELO2-interacting protein 1 like protein n=1 Tax=Eufriesea mexicana TaxID=516756 RepID=A0A310S781_9HYME|nr:PREDICTED: TELO2-interacting protein 1 homolog [Eufriesea mexicana]OAD52266.1 TELO2-interacting protein 1 like protein [Eufriesea mexicana]